MPASATISPFIGTYSADPDHSPVGFALRHMSVATFRGTFSGVEASVAVADDGSLSLSGSAQVCPVVVSAAELGAHDEGAQRSDRRGLTREVFQT